VRLDAAEHALDVRRDRAVAAEQTVPALWLRGECEPPGPGDGISYEPHRDQPLARQY
jgi:hypothetical protein